MLALIGARVLQGAGGGGLMTLSQALVGEIVPPRERPRYQGYLAGTFMVVVARSGPVAGRLADAAFRLGVGVPGQPAAGRAGGAAGVPAAARGRRRAAGSGSIGWGLALLAGFVVPLLLALEQAQRISVAAAAGDRGAGRAVAGLAVAAAAAGAAGALAADPGERAARKPRSGAPTRWRACVGAMIVGGVTFMPIYLQVVRGADPARVGLLMLPLTAGDRGRLADHRPPDQQDRADGDLPLDRAGDRGGRLGRAWRFRRRPIPLGWLPVLFMRASRSSTGHARCRWCRSRCRSWPGRRTWARPRRSVQFTRSIGAALGTALVGAVLFAVLSLRRPARPRRCSPTWSSAGRQCWPACRRLPGRAGAWTSPAPSAARS